MTKWACFKTGLLLLLLAAMGHAQARFVSVDPVQGNANNGQNFNRYYYGNNNPYKFTDPDGRQSRDLEYIHKEAARNGPHTPCCTSLSESQAGTIVDFTPGFGDAKGIADAYNNPTPASIGAAAVGLLGPVGDAAGRLIKGADNVADAAKGAPDFIVSPGGTAFPVPAGATGPTPSLNSAGNQTGVEFTGGQSGANGQVSTMRIMDPTPARGASPGYPNGYIKYDNAMGQGVDPYTGRTLPNSQSHYPIDR